MKLEEDALRGCRYRVDQNAEILNRLVDQVVDKYSRELDVRVHQLKNRLEEKDKMTADEVEQLVMIVPAYLYFAVAGLETLGTDSDAAKAVRMEAFNAAILVASGTITDKTSSAELSSMKEQMVEVIFARAYKKLKAKTEVAMQLCMSARKILEKRIQEVNVDRMDGSVRARGGQQ